MRRFVIKIVMTINGLILNLNFENSQLKQSLNIFKEVQNPNIITCIYCNLKGLNASGILNHFIYYHYTPNACVLVSTGQ